MRTALLYNFLIEANLMASIAILLMAVLRKTLRRQLGNGALCFGWLLVALRLLLPLSLPNPFINALRSPFALDDAIRPIAGQVKVRVTDALDGLSIRLWSSPLKTVGDRLWSVSNGISDASLTYRLAHIYALGVAAVVVWAVVSNVRFRLRLRTGRIEPISGKLLSQYQTLCAQRGVKPVPVYFTDPLPSACLVGVLRPYIALPLTASPQEAIHVLTHEVCHLRNRDQLWNVLRLCCCALHWFNPLVWMAAAMSRTDGELRCDDRVVAPLDADSRKAYANVLVLAAARRSAPGLGVLATGMTMTGRRLKTRVVTVLRDKKPLRWLSVSFVLLASMCLVGAFATAETRAVPRVPIRQNRFSRPTIVDEPSALAYGKTVLSLDALGGAKPEDLAWAVENAAFDPEACTVYALRGEEEVCDATFDRAGSVLEARFYAEGEFTSAGQVTLTPEEQEALAEDLRDFVALVNPDLAPELRFYQFIEQYRDYGSGGVLAHVVFYPQRQDQEANIGVSAFFVVQLNPDPHIVLYTSLYEEGNG